MSTTLEQTAEAIAEERRQVGKKQFEAAYPDILAPLQGSKMSYEVVICKNDTLGIIFSKAGIPPLLLPLQVDGQVGYTNSFSVPAAPLKPEALVTVLADFIVKEEGLAETRMEAKKLDVFYNKAFDIWKVMFFVTIGSLGILTFFWQNEITLTSPLFKVQATLLAATVIEAFCLFILAKGAGRVGVTLT